MPIPNEAQMNAEISNRYSSNDIYNKEDVDKFSQNWSLEDSKVLSTIWNGKEVKYQKYQSVIDHNKIDFWKFTTGLKAFALTFISFGLALLFKKVRQLWTASITGKEIVTIKIKFQEAPSINTRATDTSGANPTVSKDQTTSPSQEELKSFFESIEEWHSQIVRLCDPLYHRLVH